MGILMILFNIAYVIILLVLLVRFINAVEKIATASENQERQVGRLATAVEQLTLSQSRSTRPGNSTYEG